MNNLKEKIINENQKGSTTYTNGYIKYGLFNIDGYNENGIAKGNKVGIFDNIDTLKDYCKYILCNLVNEESLKKLVIVSFDDNFQKPFLQYCFENKINKEG